MLLFQFIASLFILFALIRISKGYKQERIPRNEIIVWIILWTGIAGAIWWPRGTDLLAQQLGVTRGVDLLVTASLAITFLFLFRLFTTVRHQQQEITKLVRKLALYHKQQEDEQTDS